MSSGLEWPPASSRLFRINVNSALVEGLVSIIFDIVLICSSENLCQLICSAHNLRTIYDQFGTLSIRSRRSALLGEPITGHKWMAYFLSTVLSVSTICAILLGFAVDGSIDNVTKAATYQSYAELKWPPTPVEMNYSALFEKSSSKRPELVSKRIIAMFLYDRCQICTFQKCELVSYAFENDIVDDELVNVDEYFDYIMTRGDCVTNEKFRETIPVMRFNAQDQPNLHCDVREVVLGEDLGDNFIKASISVGSCDIEIDEVICYNRNEPDLTLHCGGIGPVKDEDYLGTLVIHDPNQPQHHNIDAWIVDLSRFVSFTTEQLQTYSKHVAFMTSIDLLFDYQYGFIPFIHFSYNKTLYRIEEGKTRNVSDVNLLIAIPCITLLVVITLLLLMVYMYFWSKNIYRRGRRNFNTFSSVSEVLEVVHSDFGEGTRNPRFKYSFPEIGIRRDVPRLGIQTPGEKMVVDATWDENEIY